MNARLRAMCTGLESNARTLCRETGSRHTAAHSSTAATPHHTKPGTHAGTISSRNAAPESISSPFSGKNRFSFMLLVLSPTLGDFGKL